MIAKGTSGNSVAPEKHVRSACLFRSDFYELKNWVFDFEQDAAADKGYNDCFCLVFVRKGNFLFDLSRESYDSHTGHIVVDKPNYEYRLRPAAGECSIFNFSDEFYRQLIDDLSLKYSYFFANKNILSLLLQSTPETDYLHFQILKNVIHAGKLEMDNLVLELLKCVVAAVTNTTLEPELDAALRHHHLGTIEKAKEYMHDKFASDISLQEISTHSCVSPFHFSRIFKKFTSFSPYQYLLNIRLKHAEMLLRTVGRPVADIALAAGFNSPEHFATAFRQKYKMNPTQYRK